MSTPPAFVNRPTSPLDQDTGLSLAALLELFAPDDPGAAPARHPLRSHAAQLGAWVQETSRRAATWGAVPEIPAVHDSRPSLVTAGEPK